MRVLHSMNNESVSVLCTILSTLVIKHIEHLHLFSVAMCAMFSHSFRNWCGKESACNDNGNSRIVFITISLLNLLILFFYFSSLLILLSLLLPSNFLVVYVQALHPEQRFRNISSENQGTKWVITALFSMWLFEREHI